MGTSAGTTRLSVFLLLWIVFEHDFIVVVFLFFHFAFIVILIVLAQGGIIHHSSALAWRISADIGLVIVAASTAGHDVALAVKG